MNLKSAYGSWFGIGFDAFQLGLDATQVVMLRTAKIATGGVDGERESRLMVTEKVATMLDLQAAFMTGRVGATPQAAARTVLSHYGRKVRANRRRLAKRG